MNPQDIQKLLGGYATGTLTEAERQALFEAALHDQALFDALAREQSLHDLLRDPAARAHLLAALEPAPRRWWTWRPIAAAVAMAAIATLAVVIARRPVDHPQVADVRPIARPLPEPSTPPPPPSTPKRTPVVGARRARPAPQSIAATAPPTPKTAPPPPPEQRAADAAAPPVQTMPLLAPVAAPRASFSASNLQVAGASLQGVVRDPAGAAIRGARILAVNNFTSQSSEASTGDSGQYEFPALQPGKYTLIARAPGFRPAAVRDLQLPGQGKASRDLTLQLGSTAETVEVTTAAQIPAPSARRLFLGAATRIVTGAIAGAPPTQHLALRYTVLRKDASGAFTEAAPADLAPGDTVELRFTANAAGYLTVGDNPPVSLTAMAPYTTPPLPAGPSEIKMIFALQPQRDTLPAAVPYTEVQNRDTYVAARAPGQPLTFTVKLP